MAEYRPNNDRIGAAQQLTAAYDLADVAESAWRGFCQAPDTQKLHAFQQAVRALAASAEAEGRARVAELAGIVELMLAPVLAGEERFTKEFQSIVDDYVGAACRLSRERLTLDASPVVGVDEAWAISEVLLLEPDQRFASDLQQQLAHFGYVTRTTGDFAGLLAALDKRHPHAIIVDDAAGRSMALSPEQAVKLRQQAGERVPLIFLGERDHVEARLAAVRSGADAYLVKPIDPHELVDQLDRIGAERRQEPYHILVVEDSETQAAYYSAILKKADMVTTVVSDPLRVLDVMDESAADLVLMDMYMPRCNGMELAKVIRQVPRYASIPIVYLSAETGLDRQLDAMSLGGDDFLTKPINPAHLIRSVSIRAERARSLRTFMLTDNLTGLLNHTRIKEQLKTEVARTMRSGTPLSFAMLDIDRFKSVNDTHGHHVGDQVIKTLARVLKQRLRRSDYIGRYGGEEFAVILPDADMDAAIAILDELRAAFANIHQLAPGGAFNVTFSGGVATFPASPDAVQLALDADKALYAAKRGGRNRIVGFSPELA